MKGTLHWVSASHSINGEVRLYNHLFLNQNMHGYGVEIKAISYHLLLVEEGPPAHLRVILDL